MRALVLFALGAALILHTTGCTARSAPLLPPTEPLSRAEIETAVAPLALYPDPLLQRILTASTFPDQIVDAALFIERGGAPSEIPRKPWERSVKFVANYPSVLAFLADDIDRTIQIGSAFTESPEEVRECIQSLRRRAREHGNLRSSPYQKVIEEGTPGPTMTIRIEPTDPEVIYIPTTTTVVYEQTVDDVASLWAPIISFGLGVAVASAFDHDDFYYYGGPFYGPGFWHGGPIYRRWYDYRHDRWHHAYDYSRWRHKDSYHHGDWMRHRHDLDRKHTAWRDAHRSRSGGGPLGERYSPDSRASFRPSGPSPRRSGEYRTHPPRTPEQRAPSHGRPPSHLSSHPPQSTHRGAPGGRAGGGHGGRGR